MLNLAVGGLFEPTTLQNCAVVSRRARIHEYQGGGRIARAGGSRFNNKYFAEL